MIKVDDFINNILSVHQKIVNNVPELKQGLVKCTICGKELKVDSTKCLKYGWPECCGYTMKLQSLKKLK